MSAGNSYIFPMRSLRAASVQYGSMLTAFVLSLLFHVALGVYLEETPWAPAGSMPIPQRERQIQVQMMPDTPLQSDAMTDPGDPDVQDPDIRKTLSKKSDQFPKMPKVAQQEWFSPETVSIPSNQEDLVARTDAELSSLPADFLSSQINSEIIKIPEPKVTAPNPDTRNWAPELQDTSPPTINISPSAPMPGGIADMPVIPEPKEFIPPPLDEPIETVSAAPPKLDIPPELLSLPEKEDSADEELPEDRVEFKNWDDLLDVKLTTYHSGQGSGFFRAIITPNEAADKLKTMSKDVLFAIDASGSMEGEVFEGIKKGVVESLSDLRNGDRFNVLTFKADITALNPGLWAVNDKNIAKAKEFVSSLEASGMTDIYRSLSSVVRSLPEGDRPFLIFLFSDGRSTVGLQDTREIINALSVDNHLRAAIHVMGTGPQANKHLLSFLAYRNKGAAYFAENPADIPKKITSLVQEVSDPILVGVHVDLSGMSEEESYPMILPDLYINSSVEFFGRFSREKEVALRLTGNVRGNRKEFVFHGDLPEPDKDNADIASEWASSKVFHLLSQNLELGEAPARTSAIRELSKLYRLDMPMGK